MPVATQFCVGLDNKPGTLAKLCGALKRAKVNIDAVSVADNADCAWVRLLATPSAAAKEALTKSDFDFCTQRVLTVKAPNQPGELEGIAAKLAKAGVNINYVYGSAGEGPSVTIVLGVSDIEKAGKAIG